MSRPTLPFVFNEYPSRLVQLAMSGSVGRGGRNLRPDVALVQELLNSWRRLAGGAPASLQVDGIAGPRTIDAIARYQQAQRLFTDGRIDVNGPTVMNLVRALNARGALPHGVPGLGAPDARITRALSTTVAAGGPTSGSYDTGWDVVSSSGLDVSVGYLGVTVINIYLTHDTEPTLKKPYILSFAGAGVGLSLLPIGMDWSDASMKSWGTRVMGYPGGKKPPFNVQTFDMLPTAVITVGANVGPGWSGTYAMMGSYDFAMTGMQLGSPGASINMYVGAIAGWR